MLKVALLGSQVKTRSDSLRTEGEALSFCQADDFVQATDLPLSLDLLRFPL